MDDYPHQPGYISSQTSPDGETTYQFRQFTVLDREPQCLATFFTPEPAKTLMIGEYRAAHLAWRQARAERSRRRFFLHAGNAILAAREAWATYAHAAGQMAAAYNKLRDTPASGWPAQILRIAETQRIALHAAMEFDLSSGRQLAELLAEHQADAGDDAATLNDAAARIGADITDWHIGTIEAESDYYIDNLTIDVQAEIYQQNEHIAQAAQLSGITQAVTR